MVEVETGNCHQLVGWIKWNQKYARERGAQGSLPSLPPLSHTGVALNSVINNIESDKTQSWLQGTAPTPTTASCRLRISSLCGELDEPIVLTTIVLPLLPVIDLMNAGQMREQKDMLNLGKLWRWRRILIFLCLFIIVELRYHTHSNLSSLV